MKNNIYILYIIISILAFSSCNKSDDYFEKYNETPELVLNDDNLFDNDSVKINQNYYDVTYAVTDEEIKEITPSLVTDLRYEILNENTIRFALDEIGEYPIRVIYTDSWNKKSIVDFDLVVFENLPPVAILEVTTDGMESLIDASNSYDLDEDFQGGIELYRYFVNKKEIEKTYHSSISYIFQESGSYEIGVQVKDNDQEWSEIVYQTIKL